MGTTLQSRANGISKAVHAAQQYSNGMLVTTIKKWKPAAVNQLFVWSLAALSLHAIGRSDGNRKAVPSTTAVSLKTLMATAKLREKPQTIALFELQPKNENIKSYSVLSFPSTLFFIFLVSNSKFCLLVSGILDIVYVHLVLYVYRLLWPAN